MVPFFLGVSDVDVGGRCEGRLTSEFLEWDDREEVLGVDREGCTSRRDGICHKY